VCGERLDLRGEELGDRGEELALVAVVFVAREVRERVGPGQHRLQRGIAREDVGGRLEVGGDVARVGQLADDTGVAVEVVVVVVADDPARLDVVVDRQRVGDHVVPAALALNDAVEAGVELVVDQLTANLVVRLRDL